jgi:hypothetical protein
VLALACALMPFVPERAAAEAPAACWYRRAVEFLPCYVKAWVHLAEIYLRGEQTEDAAAALIPVAFADHGAEFYCGSGNDAGRAFKLAKANLANRPTVRAFEQAYAALGREAGLSRVAIVDGPRRLLGIRRSRHMMIDRRIFIQGVRVVATAPALAAFCALSSTGQPQPWSDVLPQDDVWQTDWNAIVFKIEGWDCCNDTAGGVDRLSTENAVWIRINRSWRAAWR